jgi:translation initiation factor IF-1
VKLDNDHEIIAYLSGKMRRYYIRVLLGDWVKVEISPYDLDQGCIVYRYKQQQAAAQRRERQATAASLSASTAT